MDAIPSNISNVHVLTTGGPQRPILIDVASKNQDIVEVKLFYSCSKDGSYVRYQQKVHSSQKSGMIRVVHCSQPHISEL